MIRSILFDIDGTLIDHGHSQEMALRRLHRHLDLQEAGLDDFVEEWKRVGKKYFDEYARGNVTLAEQRIFRVQEALGRFGREIGYHGAYGLFEIYLSFYKDYWTLYPEVKGVLSGLKSRYKLGVISNGDSCGQREKLTMTGISDMFDTIVISEDIGVAKPDPKIFYHALGELGVKPQESLYVGDDLVADIDGARASGMVDVYLNRNDDEHSHATFTINSLDELGQLLKKDNT